VSKVVGEKKSIRIKNKKQENQQKRKKGKTAVAHTTLPTIGEKGEVYKPTPKEGGVK